MFPRIGLCLLLMLTAPPAVASEIASLLKTREGLIVQVREPKRGPLNGLLVRVTNDYFCLQFGERDSLSARCYPYTAIRAITPTGPADEYYVIETL